MLFDSNLVDRLCSSGTFDEERMSYRNKKKESFLNILNKERKKERKRLYCSRLKKLCFLSALTLMHSSRILRNWCFSKWMYCAKLCIWDGHEVQLLKYDAAAVQTVVFVYYNSLDAFFAYRTICIRISPPNHSFRRWQTFGNWQKRGNFRPSHLSTLKENQRNKKMDSFATKVARPCDFDFEGTAL
jgi:hypothetical protein